MPKTIQIRGVPDKVHGKLKARAAKEGISLSTYLLKEITRLAERPTMQEVLDRIARRKPVETVISSAEVIRELREAANDRR